MSIVSPSIALVRREFLTTLRRKRSLLWLVLYVFACSIAVVAMWPEDTNLYNIGYQSTEMFAIMSMVVLGMCMLLVPGLAAGSVVVEKDRQTFDLLFLTLIRPRGILSGKLINTVGFVLLLIIAVCPLVATALLLVGLDWVQVARSIGIILATLLSCAMIGILCSAWARRSITAIMTSYAVVVFLMGGFLIIYPLLDLLFDFGLWDDFFTDLLVVCPIYVLGESLMGSMSGAEYLTAIVYQFSLFAFCWFLASRFLRRPAEPPKVETRDPIDDRKKLWERKHRFPFYMIDPLKRKKEIEDHRNPMLVKELRWGMLNRVDAMIRLFYISLVAYFCLGMVMEAWAGYDGVFNLILTQMIVTLLIAPALLSNTFTKEHEQGNYDMLRMTLLTPNEVVMGKVRAGMACMAPLVAAVFISNLPYMFLVKETGELFFAGYVTFLVCCYVSLAISIFVSLLMKRTATSLIVSYIANAYMFIGLLATVAIISLVFRWNLDNSVGMFLSPITGFTRVFFSDLNRRPVDNYLLYWGSNVLLYFGVGWFFIKWTIAGYRRCLNDR